MICSDCQHKNKSTANFCANCRTRLERLCPNCSTPADPSANFCSNCGQALDRMPTVEKQRPQKGPEQAKAKPSSYMPAYLAKKILRDRQAISGEAGIGNPIQLWKTYAAFGNLRTAQERPDIAQKLYGEAMVVIRGVAVFCVT